MTNLFEAKEHTRPEDISNPYEHLVGEGKKYKDNNSLAFAALKKDEHISTIERENAEARAELERLKTELATRGTVEDALKRLTPQTPPAQSNQDVETRTDDRINPEQVFDELYEKRRAKERDIERKQRNVDMVDHELEKAWGKDYSRKLNEVADELGGKEFLLNLAAENPKAFLKMVGANVVSMPNRPVVDTTPLTSRLNLTSTSNPNFKGHSYYQKIRRENPKDWNANSGKYQAEMEAAVAKHGAAFFEN